MDGLARQLQEYKDNLASFLRVYVSAVEKLTQNLPEQSKKGRSSSLTPTNVSATKNQAFCLQGKGTHGAHHLLPCGSSCMMRGRTQGSGMVNLTGH